MWTNRVAWIIVVAIGWLAGIVSSSRAAPFSVQRDVVYGTSENVELKADIYQPRDEAPCPAVVMIHGGAWLSGSKIQVAHHAMRIAKRGYVVMAINYRLAPKYTFPAQIDDCRAAVQWIRRNSQAYRVDPSRVAAYGYSAGGHLACLLGTSENKDRDALQGGQVRIGENPMESVRVQAVVAGGAPCEFRLLPDDSKFLSFWLGGTRAERPELYEAASPTTFASADDPPVFLFHGERDQLVPSSNPQFLKVALEKAGVPVEMHVVKDAGHIGAYLDAHTVEMAGAFLDRVLKTQR
jgi:triacylglycerol lipase